MRQHVLPVGVPDAVHVRHYVALGVEHLHLLVDGDEAATVGLGVDGRQVQPGREGGPAVCGAERQKMGTWAVEMTGAMRQTGEDKRL